MKLSPLSDLTDPPDPPLVDPYIYARELNLISGAPQTGKTMWLVYLIAHLTQGRVFPFDARPEPPALPGGCALYVSREQSAKSLKVRLAKLRADNTKVFHLSDLDVEDLDALAAIFRAYKPILMVFDPLDEFFPGGKDSVRKVLMPFLVPQRHFCPPISTA